MWLDNKNCHVKVLQIYLKLNILFDYLINMPIQCSRKTESAPIPFNPRRKGWSKTSTWRDSVVAANIITNGAHLIQDLVHHGHLLIRHPRQWCLGLVGGLGFVEGGQGVEEKGANVARVCRRWLKLKLNVFICQRFFLSPKNVNVNIWLDTVINIFSKFLLLGVNF